MKSGNDIANLMQRTRRYWYEDGFQDMGFGGFILAVGLLFFAQSLTPPGSPLWLVWGLGGPLLLVGGGLVAGAVVKRLKERITYPRTGYVSYDHARGASKTLRMLATALIAAAVSAGIIVVQKNWLSLTVIFGFGYLAVFTFLGYRFGLRRYIALAVWSLILGLALAPLPITRDQAGSIYHIGTGSAWLLAGWLTYRQYNARAPRPQEASNDTER